MPAVAVTEHGNMFSAVTFHDEARKRGIKPILGCEVYVAPGDRTRSIRARRARPPTISCCSRRPTRGSTTSSSWSRPATPTASTTSRASTRSCSRSTRSGLIGLSSCLKGEVATGLRTDQARKALEAAATYRDILGAGQLLPRDAGPGHRRAAHRQHRACCRSRASSSLPLVCTNDVHYLRQTDQHPHDVLLCIGTGKSVSDEKRLQYHGDQFFLKTADEMAAGLRRLSRRRSRTRCASPSAAT